MLPDGWKLGDFGSIGKWTGGGTPSKANDSFWMGGTIPWVSPKDMTSGKICDTEDHITPEAIKNSATRLYPSGSVMIVTRSGILRKKLPVAIAESPVTVNQDLKVLPYDKQFSPEYVYNYILCFNSEILNVCAKDGTTVESIDTNSFLNFPVKLPPLPEQKKIAAILSTWDRAIEGTEKLLSNSQQQKKALMQQLLTGKKRLPGFMGEWKPHSLSELAVMSSGGTPLSTQKDYFGGNIPWVSIADMTRCGKYISQTEKTLTKSGLDNSSAKIYPKNTVLYAMYASIGECSIASTELSCSQAILGIRTNSKLYFEYLYFYLSFLKEKIKLLGQTGTQSNLNAKMVKAFRINLPPIPEQKAISTVLSTADEEIASLESDLSRLRQEKKALMQQLLTGKRRVKVD